MGNCLTCFKTTTNNNEGKISVEPTVEPRITSGKVESCETDELLSESPAHLTSLSTDARASFKKSQVPLNGGTNPKADIFLSGKEPSVADNSLNGLFEKYKDEDEDAILSEGIEALCSDLGYKPDDFAILVLAWRLDASQMCRFTKTEFIQGLQQMKADNVEDIRSRLIQNIEKLKTNSEMFKKLYRFTFRFGLEEGNRTVTREMAIILWRLVFSLNPPSILDRWLNYLEQCSDMRGIPKDTWNMFLNFTEICDITSYDDTEAWPSLFDDFVEYETDRTNQNISQKERETPCDRL
ncbi:DCN1-like protein 3 [Pseudolycoriella hygida]|uniref:Defective in cullin neddylation protein n=1 Tax=Pseudolycoriella hygida TaxID=35572 RepID=A0A9Q0N5B6_9DIPT|nr:DCN1-like protein 3 [Pseudolycoriella hygida]